MFIVLFFIYFLKRNICSWKDYLCNQQLCKPILISKSACTYRIEQTLLKTSLCVVNNSTCRFYLSRHIAKPIECCSLAVCSLSSISALSFVLIYHKYQSVFLDFHIDICFNEMANHFSSSSHLYYIDQISNFIRVQSAKASICIWITK
jgi:hypothetical protein